MALKKMSCYINVWLTEKAEAFEKTSTADATELNKCKELPKSLTEQIGVRASYKPQNGELL